MASQDDKVAGGQVDGKVEGQVERRAERRGGGQGEWQATRYSALETPIPPHLRARMQAVAAVTGRSVAEMVESWLAKEIDGLDDARREVADRLASAALHSDLGGGR